MHVLLLRLLHLRGQIVRRVLLQDDTVRDNPNVSVDRRNNIIAHLPMSIEF